jgi:NAD(P)H-hydrate epimerase
VKAEKIPVPVLPRRPAVAHKGRCGRLLCVAGATGFAGAARICARGALSAGVGLLTVATPERVRAEVAREDAAFLTVALRGTIAGTLSSLAAREIVARAAAADAVALGPGLTTHEETVACVMKVLASLAAPAVVDADALNAVAAAGAPPALAPRVWTPHPGEAARLLGQTVDRVQSDRERAAQELWARLGGIVVLKGAGTLVTDGTALLVNPTGNPGLATGGSGDVLTGMIGAFLASGLAPLDAATAAVYIHGQAADEVRGTVGERALSIRALLETLPGIVARHEAAA